MANKIQQLKDADGNNIYPIAYVNGGVKMDLLWTNPSPTSNFDAQTTNIDLSSYQLIIVIVRRYKESSGAYCQSHIIPVNDGNEYIVVINEAATSGAIAAGRRNITITNTGITWSAGYAGTTQANDYCIPQKVYGIKMSYVVPTTVHGLQYVEVEE